MEKVEANNVISYQGLTESQVEAGHAEAADRSMGHGFGDNHLDLFPENRTEENVAAVEAALNGG